MNVTEIIQATRDETWITKAQLDDTTAVRLLNKVYRDVINSIRTFVNEDYLFFEWYADTQIHENRYSLNRKNRIPWKKWQVKVKTVSMKFKKDKPYILLKERNEEDLCHDLSRYEKHTLECDAFYCILGNYLYTFPQVKYEVTNWIKLTWIADPLDLEIDTTSDEILVPLEAHDYLVLWLNQMFYRNQRLRDQEQVAKATYDEAMLKMTKYLKRRWPIVSQAKLPPLFL